MGAALGAKRLAPSVALGTLVVAAYLPDWVDAALCLGGRYGNGQMFSHSVPAVIVLAILAAATQMRNRDRGAALIVAAVVVSHILLDYLTGIKPTWPGGPMIGLELYSRPLIEFFLEAAVIVGGWIFYRGTLPSGQGRLSASSLMLGLLLLMQAAVDVTRLLSPAVNKC